MLLSALQSPCASVRDTVLRVRAHSLLGPLQCPLSLVQVFELHEGHSLKCPINSDGRCLTSALVCPGGKKGHSGNPKMKQLS